MKYERIIIGGGAAGLFCAASCPVDKGLILEKQSSPGQKLLLSGSGQCNLTHNGSIKEFIGHYGENGSRIRSALYRGNNLLLMKFFTENGVLLEEREDGKIFPKSRKAGDVLNLLLELSKKNGWELRADCPVDSLEQKEDGSFLVNRTYVADEVIIATGGCSYPNTGSDGNLFPLLKNLGLKIIPPRPALVPLTVRDYPYGGLSGISFQSVTAKLDGHRLTGDLLLTHGSFSGPVILNLARWAKPGSELKLCYIPGESHLPSASGDRRQALTFFSEELNLPRRFTEQILRRGGIEPSVKAASLSGSRLKTFQAFLKEDTFQVTGTSGFSSAMATAGGVCLDEVDLKTFECKNIPGLFIIGEALDIDGDTGGYNLQFAFSSGYCAAKHV